MPSATENVTTQRATSSRSADKAQRKSKIHLVCLF